MIGWIPTVTFIGMTVIIPTILLSLHSKSTTELNIIEFELNKCESPIERRLFKALTYRGFNVKTQEKCGPYRIDLVLPLYRIAIECDGKAYHSSPEQKKRDKRKTNYLRRHGWSVLRFTGSDINGNMSKVIRRIEGKINQSKS